MGNYVKAAFVFLICFILLITALAAKHSPVTAQITRASAVDQGGKQFPSNVGLNCAGCHGPGKTLPYLAGRVFHEDAHKALDTSIHSELRADGKPIASCRTCHTLDGDLSTILPATDPRSTINRANIAETCGRCHGDNNAMQGTGISNRLLLSYRESVHAKAIARGNVTAAVCTDCHTSHSVLPAVNEASTISRANVAQTCGKCHSGEATQFLGSVHGQAVVRGEQARHDHGRGAGHEEPRPGLAVPGLGSAHALTSR